MCVNDYDTCEKSGSACTDGIKEWLGLEHEESDSWERIVRCRDCESYKAEFVGHADVCLKFSDYHDLYPALSHWVHVEPDGFCAWGETKEVME